MSPDTPPPLWLGNSHGAVDTDENPPMSDAFTPSSPLAESQELSWRDDPLVRSLQSAPVGNSRIEQSMNTSNEEQATPVLIDGVVTEVALSHRDALLAGYTVVDELTVVEPTSAFAAPSEAVLPVGPSPFSLPDPAIPPHPNGAPDKKSLLFSSPANMAGPASVASLFSTPFSTPLPGSDLDSSGSTTDATGLFGAAPVGQSMFSDLAFSANDSVSNPPAQSAAHSNGSVSSNAVPDPANDLDSWMTVPVSPVSAGFDADPSPFASPTGGSPAVGSFAAPVLASTISHLAQGAASVTHAPMVAETSSFGSVAVAERQPISAPSTGHREDVLDWLRSVAQVALPVDALERETVDQSTERFAERLIPTLSDSATVSETNVAPTVIVANAAVESLHDELHDDASVAGPLATALGASSPFALQDEHRLPEVSQPLYEQLDQAVSPVVVNPVVMNPIMHAPVESTDFSTPSKPSESSMPAPTASPLLSTESALTDEVAFDLDAFRAAAAARDEQNQPSDMATIRPALLHPPELFSESAPVTESFATTPTTPAPSSPEPQIDFDINAFRAAAEARDATREISNNATANDATATELSSPLSGSSLFVSPDSATGQQNQVTAETEATFDLDAFRAAAAARDAVLLNETVSMTSQSASTTVDTESLNISSLQTPPTNIPSFNNASTAPEASSTEANPVDDSFVSPSTPPTVLMSPLAATEVATPVLDQSSQTSTLNGANLFGSTATGGFLDDLELAAADQPSVSPLTPSLPQTMFQAPVPQPSWVTEPMPPPPPPAPPSGIRLAAPIDTAPVGIAPIGTAPVGTAPVGTAPVGVAPVGTTVQASLNDTTASANDMTSTLVDSMPTDAAPTLNTSVIVGPSDASTLQTAESTEALPDEDVSGVVAWRSDPSTKKPGGLLRKPRTGETADDRSLTNPSDAEANNVATTTYDSSIASQSQQSSTSPAVALASFDERPWAQPLPALPDNAPVLIVAKNVVKNFRVGTHEVPVLRHLDLEIRNGEFLVLTGPSGSGKSTLLHCLAGLDEVTSGEVSIDGMDLGLLTDGERTRHRASAMGFVFQDYNLLPVLSAVENVELPLLLNGWSPSESREEAIAALTLLGLKDRLNHPPAALSGGEQQRVTIARSLVGEPSIVWADEPTGNLDDATTEQVMHLLRELNADGLTIVMATHDATIAGIAHRTVDLRNGVLTEVPRKTTASQR